MRVLFFGTASFAVPALRALLASEHEVLAVVTQPDRPQGRGLQLVYSPVKKALVSAAPDLPILQPERARAKEFVASVRELSPDVLVVAAFGQILPQRLLDIPPHGGINIHGSLLPRWRGAAPMQYALMAGDTETGVTTMQMAAGLDTGDMLLKESTPIGPEDDVDTLEQRLSQIGARLMLQTLKCIENKSCPPEPQDDSLSTYAPALPPDIGYLDWDKPASELASLVRGVTPRPGAFAFWQGRRLKVWRAKAQDGFRGDAPPGEILSITATGIIVQSGQATALLLEEVQPESKTRMSADAWARGARLVPGAQLEKPPANADA